MPVDFRRQRRLRRGRQHQCGHLVSAVVTIGIVVTALSSAGVEAQRRMAPLPRGGFPAEQRPAADDKSPSERLVPPAGSTGENVDDDATDELFFVVAVQLGAAALGGAVLTPLAWGGPFVAVQTFVPERDIVPAAITLVTLSLVAIPVFAFTVGVVASVAGAVFGRKLPPGMRPLIAGGTGALTGALCGGGLGVLLLASLPLAAASVGFWLIGLPMTALVSAAVATIGAIYLEGRDAAMVRRQHATSEKQTQSLLKRRRTAMRF